MMTTDREALVALDPQDVRTAYAYMKERNFPDIAACRVIQQAYAALSAQGGEQTAANRTDYVSRAMVDAFLEWPLPKSFSPDCGIKFEGAGIDPSDYKDGAGYLRSWPIGTNLFSAEQAREMLEYVMKRSRELEGERVSKAVEGLPKAFEGLGAGRKQTAAKEGK